MKNNKCMKELGWFLKLQNAGTNSYSLLDNTKESKDRHVFVIALSFEKSTFLYVYEWFTFTTELQEIQVFRESIYCRYIPSALCIPVLHFSFKAHVYSTLFYL